MGFYSLIRLYVALALVLGASVETLIARQWRWLAIIATVSFVSAGIIIAPLGFSAVFIPDVLGALGLPRRGGAPVVLLLPPVLVTFAYAITRIIRRPIVP